MDDRGDARADCCTEQGECSKRKKQHGKTVRDPEKVRAYESLKLARKELQAQLTATTNDRRRTQLNQAIAEVDKRIAEASAALDS